MTIIRHTYKKGEKPILTPQILAELEALKKMQPHEIDLSDAPEELDWSNAVHVNFFAKKPFEQFSTEQEISNVVLDNDILEWLKDKHSNMNQYINQILRQTMQQEMA